jgi:hypothetical protein
MRKEREREERKREREKERKKERGNDKKKVHRTTVKWPPPFFRALVIPQSKSVN